MRKNFKLMSSLATHTRVGPADRIQKLRSFNQRLMGVSDIVEEFSKWNLSLDNRLVEVPGRVIPVDDILFSGDKVKVSDQASWQRDMRDKKLFSTGALQSWAVLCPYSLRRECDVCFIFYYL